MSDCLLAGRALAEYGCVLQSSTVSQNVLQNPNYQEVAANPTIAEEELLEVQFQDGSVQYMTEHTYKAENVQHACTAADEYSQYDMHVPAHGHFADQNSQPNVPKQHAVLPSQCRGQQQDSTPFANNSSALPEAALENGYMQDCTEQDDNMVHDLQSLAQPYDSFAERERGAEACGGLSQVQALHPRTHEGQPQVAIAIGKSQSHHNITLHSSCAPTKTHSIHCLVHAAQSHMHEIGSDLRDACKLARKQLLLHTANTLCCRTAGAYMRSTIFTNTVCEFAGQAEADVKPWQQVP